MRGFARSFTGGELTPEFFGQLTDAKYQTGLALARNFRVLPHGPIQNRAGFEFVLEVKDSTKKTRLMPFTYSTTQTMALEVGENFFRFHTMDPTTLRGSTLLSGGVPYEVANTYLQADVFGIKYVQSADVFTMAHVNYPPAELRRGGVTSWTFTPISFATTLVAPSPAIARTLGATPGTPILHRYAVTSVASNNIDESLVSSDATSGQVQATITGITKAVPGVFTTAAAHGLLPGDPIDTSQIAGMTQANLTGLIVNTAPTATTFTVSQGVTPVDTSGYSTYTSGGVVKMTYGIKNNLFDTGASNTISWGATTGALRYNIYKYSNGLWGYLGQASGTSFVDNNITPDISHTPPEAANPFASANNYPGAVTYFDQRRVFAGTINQPQNMWLTRAGTESNLTYSIPTRDSDSISFRVVAREANTVRHLVPLASLVALTSSAEWRVTSVNTDSLTPTSIDVKPQSYIGANDTQPVIVNNNVVYAAARGGHVREAAYQYTAGGYVTGDLSLRAPHLFDQLDIVDMAFSKAPYPIIWFVSSNGNLLSLTYVPEQQIGAWAHHDTDGVFESICVVAEGAEDVLYAIVRRTISGTQRRYVERMRPRVFATPADAFFVDCGGTFTSATPVTNVTGANWLEGKTISILADGAVHRQLVVTGGAFTLDNPASKIQFGLPITADIQTLPMANQTEAAGQGKRKNVNKVFLRVKDSSAPQTGPDFASLVAPKVRTTEPYGSPPRLQTGEIEVINKAAWTDGAQVCIRQTDPLPLTLISMTIDYAEGG